MEFYFTEFDLEDLAEEGEVIYSCECGSVSFLLFPNGRAKCTGCKCWLRGVSWEVEPEKKVH